VLGNITRPPYLDQLIEVCQPRSGILGAAYRLSRICSVRKASLIAASCTRTKAPPRPRMPNHLAIALAHDRDENEGSPSRHQIRKHKPTCR